MRIGDPTPRRMGDLSQSGCKKAVLLKPPVTRRELIIGAAAVPAAAALGGGVAAARARVPFGAAANHHVLPTDQPYRAALARHCDVLVAESCMKWEIIRARRETYDYTHADALVAFAKTNALAVRGHTLVWCEANPDWVKTLATAREADHELSRHIERTVSRYRGTITSWDVVNEPIAEKPLSDKDLRPGQWPTLLGPRYIDTAFKLAASVDPTGQRVLNEYGIEGTSARDRLKRAAFRRLILDLKDRGVAINAVGLQAHLDGAIDVDVDGIAKFCAEMASLGLAVLVTELDVNDMMLPANHAERDALVAKRTRDFLGAVFAGCRPDLVCTWGLTDRYTWVPTYFKRRDGDKNRPLPLDADLKPKPMLDAIQHFCRGA